MKNDFTPLPQMDCVHGLKGRNLYPLAILPVVREKILPHPRFLKNLPLSLLAPSSAAPVRKLPRPRAPAAVGKSLPDMWVLTFLLPAAMHLMNPPVVLSPLLGTPPATVSLSLLHLLPTGALLTAGRRVMWNPLAVRGMFRRRPPVTYVLSTRSVTELLFSDPT